MEREHTVSMSVTNGEECICNPEILLGTVFGIWNMQKQVAPRGTLLDLNAAWELFLSKKELVNDLKFDEYYHHQHEVIDGVVYEDGDTTYTLMDPDGNKTQATFTIKANKGPVEHIDWQDGNLILYYTKTRPLTQEDIDSGIEIHYVYDEHGQPIIDPETGKPLIYDYVKIPIIEIFDNHETHKLFPWFADDQHTVRLRQNLDDNANNHLGDVAITSDSEVFIAKEKFPENTGNTLVSIQSVYDQLKKDLGINPKYTDTEDYIDTEGSSIHQRVTGSDIEEKLQTTDKTSLVNAINEDKTRVDKTHKLINAQESKTEDEALAFCDYILNHKNNWINNTRNLLEALNWIQEVELGSFIDDIQVPDVNTVTEALNSIFQEAEENRERIGFKNGQWIALTTDKNENLTEAINEVDEHTNELAKIVNVKERWDQVNKKTYYDNPELNAITKGRLRPTQPNKNDTTIVEDINELQSQIGNLDSGRSGITSWQELTTDNKNTVVEAINEVDLHADNNEATIGAIYPKNNKGQKNGDIENLQTTNKGTIVEAINELDARAGELEDLNTDDKSNLVAAINEVIKEQPLVYEDTEDPDSGVKLKNQNNTAGKKSLVVGENNSATKYSIVGGQNNTSLGDNSIVTGKNNTSKKQFSQVSGESNNNDGYYNNIFGKNNLIEGDNNIVNGTNNNVESNGSIIIGDNNVIESDNVSSFGDSNNIKGQESNALGSNNTINGDNSTTIGKNNEVNKDSIALGINNESRGENDYSVGKNNFSNGNNNHVSGDSNSIEGNNNYIFGQNQSIVEGNNNIIIGNQQKEYRQPNNSIIIGEINEVHSNSTHIGRDIYVQTHDTESQLQKLIFVDLNDWCKKNNAQALNGEKFLDSSHLVSALLTYLHRNYTDNAIIRFKMQNENENGLIIVQGKSKRIYVNGTWYFSDNIENGWSRHEGTYLKVIRKDIVDQQGHTQSKYYLAFKDQLSTEDIVDTVGAQRSNTEDYGDIDLTHAYGAVDFEDFDEALGLSKKLRTKVDKTAKIITQYHNPDGTITPVEQNFVDPNNPNLSSNITLDLEENFGFNPDSYQLRGEKGEPNGYVPLNEGGLIDAQYLPSFVDDVLDIWAEYQVDDATGEVFDIHLYKLEEGIDPATGHRIPVKGEEITQGEVGKIYIEANPTPHRRYSAQFRWSGSVFVAIGFSNLVIGETTGTAYDGGKGKQLREDFDDHKASGTTQIPVVDPETGETKSVTYKPNPHKVTPHQMDIAVNDPNDPMNTDFKPVFIRDYTVAESIQALFNRLNTVEDSTGSISAALGTQEEIETLEEKDKTVIGLLLEVEEEIKSFTPSDSQDIQSIVTDNLKFYGED